MNFFENENGVFITLANARWIISNSELKSQNFEGVPYKRQIHFFSNFEKNYLLAIREFLKNPEEYFKSHYKPINITDTFTLVYEGNKPAYHTDKECELLNSNYYNIEIPEEVREKGREAILEFRKWFKKYEYLLEDSENKNNLLNFAENLRLRWGVNRHIDELIIENSGYIGKSNYKIEDLENEIDKLIKAAGRYYYENDKNEQILRRFSKLTFLRNRDDELRINDTPYSDIEIKEFLADYYDRFKKPLKILLTEYYRLTFNPDIKLKGKLLEQLNFKPCGKCYSLI